MSHKLVSPAFHYNADGELPGNPPPVKRAKNEETEESAETLKTKIRTAVVNAQHDRLVELLAVKTLRLKYSSSERTALYTAIISPIGAVRFADHRHDFVKCFDTLFNDARFGLPIRILDAIVSSRDNLTEMLQIVIARGLLAHRRRIQEVGIFKAIGEDNDQIVRVIVDSPHFNVNRGSPERTTGRPLHATLNLYGNRGKVLPVLLADPRIDPNLTAVIRTRPYDVEKRCTPLEFVDHCHQVGLRFDVANLIKFQS